MPRNVAPLLPPTEQLLCQFGDRLRLARLRRRLSAKQVAVRAGMAPMTLRSLERGRSGVTMGAYLAVMQVLGIEKDLDLLAQADPTGRTLQDARLSARRNRPARVKPSSVPNPTQSRRPAPVDAAATQLHHLIEEAPQAQLHKVFEALPTEEMRSALEALPKTQIQKALSILPSEQLREMAATSTRAMEDLLKPAEDARNWIEKNGFASSQALADLIGSVAPPSKAKGR